MATKSCCHRYGVRKKPVIKCGKIVFWTPNVTSIHSAFFDNSAAWQIDWLTHHAMGSSVAIVRASCTRCSQTTDYCIYQWSRLEGSCRRRSTRSQSRDSWRCHVTSSHPIAADIAAVTSSQWRPEVAVLHARYVSVGTRPVLKPAVWYRPCIGQPLLGPEYQLIAAQTPTDEQNIYEFNTGLPYIQYSIS